MKVSYHPMFDNPTLVSDSEMMRNQLRLLDLAEPLGFDTIMCIEHHFDRAYAVMPDNFQLLAYMASRTSSIELGLSAVIVPWHNPMRVIGQICLLDQLSDGRVLVGLGRGLSRMEYEGFGIPMDESRERFDEGAEMILRGLRTGTAEGDGRFYPQRAVEIHPVPARSFDDRVYTVGMSPGSCMAAGQLGTGLLTFITGSFEQQHLPMIAAYRERHLEDHRTTPLPVLLNDFIYCSEDPEEVRRAREYGARSYAAAIRHYEFDSPDLGKTKGYEAYGKSAEAIHEAGIVAAAEAWCDAQMFGTPDRLLERYRERVAIAGNLRFGTVFSFGGMPIEQSEASMRLFAAKVMPELQRWEGEPRAGRAVASPLPG